MSGNIYDRDRKVVQKRLISKLKQDTDEILRTYMITDTYLFCIDFMMNRVRMALSPSVSTSIRQTHKVDIPNYTPLDILEIIQKKQK